MYEENPVYPKDWRMPPKFKKGDRVKVTKFVPHEYALIQPVHGTVRSYHVYEPLPPRMLTPQSPLSWGEAKTHYLVDIDEGDWGKQLVDEVDMERFEGNPVYPKEWGTGPFKTGDRVVITTKTSYYRGRHGTVVAQGWERYQGPTYIVQIDDTVTHAGEPFRAGFLPKDLEREGE